MAVLKSPKNTGKKQTWVKLKTSNNTTSLGSNLHSSRLHKTYKAKYFSWKKSKVHKSNLLLNSKILMLNISSDV
jgi:hypothetical protein